MGSRPQWRRPRVEPGGTLALLELVASESPHLVRFTVETLADSPARVVLLELVKLFGIKQPAELIGRLPQASAQLDRLEIHAKGWRVPRDLFGEDALPAAVLSSFAEARANRGRRQGRRRPPELMRVDRLLRMAAERERSADLVGKYLEAPQSPGKDLDRGAALVQKFLK